MALTIVTNPISSIATITATSGGNSISGTVTGSITAKGVCWSTTTNPTTSLSTKTNDVSTYPGTANFTSSLTSLTQGTTYYLRAYVTDSNGTYYGANVVFTTLGLTTITPTSITSTTATSGATSVSGFTSISSLGVCWNTTGTPIISNNKTVDVLVGNTFTSYITGLLPGTLYYVRAYVVNGITEYYGNQQTFTTTSLVPSVQYTSISNITTTGAQIAGYVSSNNGASITACGVRYSIYPDFTSSTNAPSISVTTSFTTNLTGLTPSTTYYYILYSQNSVGTGFSEVRNFTTLGGPIVKTVTPYSITSSTAQTGCIVLINNVTARGVVISTSPSPTIATGVVYADAYLNTNEFLVKLTGLVRDTTYYVRGYATNSVGTNYGEELIFSTTSCAVYEEPCEETTPTVECESTECQYIIPMNCIIGDLISSVSCSNTSLEPEDNTLISELLKINELLCSLSTNDYMRFVIGTIINNQNLKTVFCNISCSRP